jgi:L-cystine uptake protein TcyP (sodium:dicarboxylate symporter family)
MDIMDNTDLKEATIGVKNVNNIQKINNKNTDFRSRMVICMLLPKVFGVILPSIIGENEFVPDIILEIKK